MKHFNYFFLMILSITGLLLVACTKDDDSEVFVGANPFEISGIDIPQGIPTDQDYTILYRKLLPTDSVPELDKSGNVIGYNCYVDLGLSVNWAVGNVGIGTLQPHVGEWKSFDNFYIYSPNYVSDDTGMEYPKTMTYKEFITYLETSGGTTLDYSNVQKTYYEAINKYNAYIASEMFPFTQNAGLALYWGYNDVTNKVYGTMDSYNDPHYKSVPSDYSGNATYDAATNKWGSKWRTPTKSEMQELIDKCQFESVQIGNVSGIVVTGPSQKAIFLPNYNSSNCYLTSTKDDSNPYWDYFYFSNFGSREGVKRGYNGLIPFTLRPVINK
jgi:hypothetical protein